VSCSDLFINGSLDVKSTFTLETIGNVATAINEKQDILIPGENITIIDNVISSSGGGGEITQSDLDLNKTL
jgi:hypothetical protein